MSRALARNDDQPDVESDAGDLSLDDVASDSYLLERDLVAAGFTSWRHRGTWFVAGPDADKGPTIGAVGSFSPLTAKLHIHLVDDRRLQHNALRAAGLPVPSSRTFRARRADDIVRYAASLGSPVVLRSISHKRPSILIGGLDGGEAINDALTRILEARGGRATVQVEADAGGSEYRLLTTPLGTISAIEVDRRHGGDHSTDERPAQRVTVGRVRLYTRGGLDRRGTVTDVTDDVHPELLDLAARAAAACPGLGHAEVHLRSTGHRSVDDARGATVLAVDPSPLLGTHEYPHHGQGGRVTGRWLAGIADPPWHDRDAFRSHDAITVNIDEEPDLDAAEDRLTTLVAELGLEIVGTPARAGGLRCDVTGPLGVLTLLSPLLSRAAGSTSAMIVQTERIAASRSANPGAGS